MSRDIESIKEKIRKLLALAADPSSQGAEAETAGRQAAKLMAKWKLDEYDLQGSKDAVHDFDLTQEEAMSARPGKRFAREVPPWIGFIAVGVAAYCGVVGRRSGPRLSFAGNRTDVELAVWLHKALTVRCYEASVAACQGMGQGESNAWRNGYASAIQARLRTMRAQREEAEREEISTAGTSLVVVRDQLSVAIKEAFGEQLLKKSSTRTSMSGREAGAAAPIPTNRVLS